MGDIGSGSGSSYPGSLDTQNTPEVNSPNAGKTKARAEVPNDLAAAAIAIEKELGTNPAGILTNVKTFLQTEHGTDGTHTDITATSIVSAGGIQTDGTNMLKTKVIDIGDWDMFAGTGTASVSVAHGLTLANIRVVNAMVRSDTDISYFSLTPGSITAGPPDGYIASVSATHVTLNRLTGGGYDSTSFDSTSFNRGWITITYIA